MRRRRLVEATLAALLLACSAPGGARTVEYTGVLSSEGQPAEGKFRLRVTPYSSAVGGGSLSGAIVVPDVGVQGGRFSTRFDVDPALVRHDRFWLQVEVAGDDGVFVPLPAREQVSSKTLAGVCWDTGGNALAGGEFIGSTNDQPFVVRQNNQPMLSIQPGSWLQTTDPNVAIGVGLSVANAAGTQVAGGANTASASVFGAIGGGYLNELVGNYSAIGGGYNNTTANSATTIGGGENNPASGNTSTLAGGGSNTASSPGAFIGGGVEHVVTGLAGVVGGGKTNKVEGQFGTVAGGDTNLAKGDRDAIGGGILNTTGTFYDQTISGGNKNSAAGPGAAVGGGVENLAGNGWATVAGGLKNDATGATSTVAGGSNNAASATNTYVGGGDNNDATAEYSAAVAGRYNAATGPRSFIGGGENNFTAGSGSVVVGGANNIASAQAATVLGGEGNTAGGKYAFAGGVGAKANYDRMFSWNGSLGAFNPARYDAGGIPNGWESPEGTFNVQAPGGVWFVMGYSGGNGIGPFVSPGSGTWGNTSSRTVKTAFAAIDADDVLARVLELPLGTWRYLTEAEHIRHLGPAAEDFAAAFGLGPDDKSISSIDSDGVALAAIQGLNARLERDLARMRDELADRDGELARLRGESSSLAERMAELERRLSDVAVGVERP
jgi:hypothetical protein